MNKYNTDVLTYMWKTTFLNYRNPYGIAFLEHANHTATQPFFLCRDQFLIVPIVNKTLKHKNINGTSQFIQMV